MPFHGIGKHPGEQHSARKGPLKIDVRISLLRYLGVNSIYTYIYTQRRTTIVCPRSGHNKVTSKSKEYHVVLRE